MKQSSLYLHSLRLVKFFNDPISVGIAPLKVLLPTRSEEKQKMTWESFSKMAFYRETEILYRESHIMNHISLTQIKFFQRRIRRSNLDWNGTIQRIRFCGFKN